MTLRAKCGTLRVFANGGPSPNIKNMFGRAHKWLEESVTHGERRDSARDGSSNRVAERGKKYRMQEILLLGGNKASALLKISELSFSGGQKEPPFQGKKPHL